MDSPVGSPSHAQQQRFKRSIRGGFSTSICDMFLLNPTTHRHNRTDCCSLVCCGALQADRNRFLLLNERPSPPLWLRLIAFIVIPAIVFVVAGTIASFAVGDVEDNPAGVVVTFLVAGGVVALVCLVMVLFSRSKHLDVRRALLTKIYHQKYGTETSPSGGNTERRLSLSNYLSLHEADTKDAHRVCGCYRVDISHTLDEDEPSDDQEVDQDIQFDAYRGDLCSCIWKTIANLFWGECCRCWCLCCGMCGTAQEARDIVKMVPREELFRDYLTMELFRDYYGSILNLRSIRDTSIFSHLRSLSGLSKRLLKWFVWGFILASLLLIVFPTILSNKQLGFLHFVVLCLTILQALVVLYFVHWFWNRFDVSLDAVIKFFASGFVLATSISMVVELMVSAVASFFEIIVAAFVLAGDPSFNTGGTGGGDNTVDPLQFAKDHIWLFMLKAFINAFLVAALVEEISKYFCFWIVEHPDFLDPSAIYNSTETSSAATEDTIGEAAVEGNITDETEEEEETISGMATDRYPKPTVTSFGRAITIGMVATALGFACAENVLYIFVYAPPGVVNESVTLLIRSLYPIHPLAAALQSIGVCRRDLEGDSTHMLGRILLPALLLHGTYDFIAMAAPVWQAVHNPPPDTTTDDDQTMSWSDITDNLVLFGVLMGVQLLGLAYYVIKARSQRRRLMELDQMSQRTDASSSLLI